MIKNLKDKTKNKESFETAAESNATKRKKDKKSAR